MMLGRIDHACKIFYMGCEFRTSSSSKLFESAYGGPESSAGSRTPFQSTDNHPQSSLRRTTSCIDQYEIQKTISLLETQSDEDQWRLQLQADLKSQLHNNAAGPASTSSKQQQQQQQPAVDLAGFSFPSWPMQQQ